MPEIIINFQGDMPNLNPQAIKDLAEHMKKNVCDIGTLASEIGNNNEQTLNLLENLMGKVSGSN